MFWHPLLLAIISVDVVTLFLLVATGLTAFRTVLHWQPLSADQSQLALEATVETAAIQGRAAYGLLLLSAFLLLFGITNVFHEGIPGAMCGTGVFQAMGGGGPKLLFYTGLTIMLLQFWRELDRLNRLHKDMPLTEINARCFLLIPPVAILALNQTRIAFASIHPHRPVDCCAIVYDQFRTLQQAKSIAGVPDMWWIGALMVLSVLLVGLSTATYLSADSPKKLRDALSAVTLLWLPVSALTLVNVLSAYHYGVLHHHCPWCLFLPDHNLVGYPLYGSMGFIAMEGLTIFILPRLVKNYPGPFGQTLLRCRLAGRRILIASMIFFVFAAAPPIVWRLRYGVWMTG